MNRWTLYNQCALCAATTSKLTGDDRIALGNACDAEARGMGWRLLPERKIESGPRRFATWICADCLRDINAAAPVNQKLVLPEVG